MIPLTLSLKNFFSYRNVLLDFRGLHTACICGPNGSGKSSLLEAITWVLWGECRAKTNENVILAGASDVRVDFDFSLNNDIYRVIRSYERVRSTSLEFQIQTHPGRFSTLTGKGVNDTQARIISNLNLDYDTFINSAYLRQGKADEFMLNGPNERKKILAKMLKLEQYDHLSEKAKEQSKEYKLQAQQLENRLTTIEEQLGNQQSVEAEKKALQENIQQKQQDYQTSQQTLQELQKLQSQRQFWEDQIKQSEQQYQNTQQEYQRLTREKESLSNQLQKMQEITAREAEINHTYHKFLQLQEEEDSLRSRFQEYQIKHQDKQQLEKDKNEQLNQVNSRIFEQKTKLQELEKQEQEIQKILSETTAIEAGIAQFILKRQHLQELDKIQAQITPLIARRYQLETSIERVKAQLTAQLDQTKKESLQLKLETSKKVEVTEQLSEVINQLDELDKLQVYLKRIEEKINNKKLAKQKVEQTQQLYNQQLEEIEQKSKLLDTPEATCPLCQSELEGAHRELVISQMQQQTEQIKESLWNSYEENTRFSKELNELEIEAKKLQSDLQAYGELQHKLSQIEAKLDILAQKEFRIKNEIQPLITQLEERLEQGNYAVELQTEHNQILKQITELNYNDQTHSLMRTEVDRLRSHEFRKNELEKAKEKQASINTRRPLILQTIESLEKDLVELEENSDITQLEGEIAILNYDPLYHQSISGQLRQIRDAQNHYQQLAQYKEELPSLQNRLKELEEVRENQIKSCQSLTQQIEKSKIQTQECNDYRKQIEDLHSKIKEIELKLGNLNQQKGSLEERLSQLEQLLLEHTDKRKLKREIERSSRVYEELAKAFGKGGIQTMMIENMLPQLEAEANYILSRLTQNQLHVTFSTKRNPTSGSRKNRENKEIETLDILIADNNTTRPYEGYSGGEAFRVNFSIRLALSRVLAQKAGTSLQLLIIDEGFGTQDAEGCDRLIAAINTIAPDFACILTVTHMPQFKEAFQQRIEVIKTDQGSEVRLIA